MLPTPKLTLDAPPDEDDSLDLTNEDVQRAVLTTSAAEVASMIASKLKERSGWAIKGHELRRRKPSLYWINTLRAPTGETETLIFKVDWLKSQE